MAKRRKYGGRRKGTPNKATVEKAAIAEQIVARAEMQGRKLAKEVLDEFMHLFAGMAATFQPLPPGQAVPEGREPNETKFEKWARLAIQCAKDLASYQSPTYRAVAMTGIDPSDRTGVVRFVVENAPLMIEGKVVAEDAKVA